MYFAIFHNQGGRITALLQFPNLRETILDFSGAGLHHRPSRQPHGSHCQDEAAITLGVDLSKRRRVYMVLTSLLSAVAVCTCGIVGFVGLMIPHIVRGFVGSDHRFLLPMAALSGGVFLIWADVISRIIIANTEIPIGVITSAIGAPIFVYMMVKKSYGFGGHD